jgi:hypothetical protein
MTVMTGPIGIIVGLVVAVIVLVVGNLIYSSVMSAIPSGSATLFDLSGVTTAASLIGVLFIIIVAGAAISYILNIFRGY